MSSVLDLRAVAVCVPEIVMATSKPPAHLQSMQLWEHRAALILGILHRVAVHFVEGGGNASAGKRPNGACVFTIVALTTCALKCLPAPIASALSRAGKVTRRTGSARHRYATCRHNGLRIGLGNSSARQVGEIPSDIIVRCTVAINGCP
jgi:hypothetical protein